jgi:hypothetical protein
MLSYTITAANTTRCSKNQIFYRWQPAAACTLLAGLLLALHLVHSLPVLQLVLLAAVQHLRAAGTPVQLGEQLATHGTGA